MRAAPVSFLPIECAVPAAKPFPICQEIIKKITMTEVVKYLRGIAQICTRLARVCPDLPTSHGLEEIAMLSYKQKNSIS
jgi:hypothetical protein